MRNSDVRKLVDEALKLRYSRRQILKRASVLGLAGPALYTVLAACGEATPDEEEEVAAAGEDDEDEPDEAVSDDEEAESDEEAEPDEDEEDDEGIEPGEAPAQLQGTSLTILQATYFVPAAQDLFEEQAKQWGEENGVNVEVDFVNWPDLQPRIGAAVQSGSGPDIIEMWDTWPYLYAGSLVNVHDMAMDIGDSLGGYYDWVTRTASVDGEWFSIPHGTSTSAFAYRISYFREAGVEDKESFPKTWEELFEVGKRLKEMGKPLGQAFGHSTGDPPSHAYSYMWAYGAMEVEDDGETVAFHRPEFIDGMRLMIQAWQDAYDETGLSWDDATNNRAFLADEISGTFNGSSIYLAAKDENPELAEDTDHVGYFEGPAGRFNLLGSRSHGILSHSDNVDGAKEFLEWWYHPDRFRAWQEAQQGYNLTPVPEYIDDPYYTEDPKLEAYAEVAEYARNKGYAGPSNQDAALSFSRYIVVDTFARALDSGDAEEAIEWGADQLERIYS
jgi:multiple sugar transport system substrate-binding protein